MTKMFKPSPFYGIGNLDDESIPMIENKQQRKIDDVPYKVLDAPELSDDFYLNLVDWSDSNMLAVGLLNRVYTWSAAGSPIVKLHEFEQDQDRPASLCFSRHGGDYLAAGSHRGLVHVFDIHTQKLLRTFSEHRGRVAALSWNNQNILSSASKDRTIMNRDLRIKEQYVSRIEAHREEVCGIKWSFDDRLLASGGNDNRLKVWDIRSQ